MLILKSLYTDEGHVLNSTTVSLIFSFLFNIGTHQGGKTRLTISYLFINELSARLLESCVFGILSLIIFHIFPV